MNQLTRLATTLAGTARGRLVVLFAFALLAVIVALRSSHRKDGALFVSDGFGYYIYLPSLIIDGDLDLSNQIARQEGQEDQEFYEVQPATGLRGNPFQVGCAVLWLPFFLGAHAVVWGLNLLGLNVPRDGFGLAYELPVYCGSFVYGLLGLHCTRKLLAALWGGAVATMVTALTALATAAGAYLWFEPDMCHIVSLALIAMLFYRLYRIRQANDRRAVSWAVAGALCGLIVAVRATDLFVGLAVAWVGVVVFFRRPSGGWAMPSRELVRCLAAFAAAAFVCFLPQLLVWKVLYGHFLVVPSSTNYGRMRWLQPDIWGYFFSLKRGLFIWTPVLLPAVVGLVLAWWKGPAVVRCASLVLVLAVYFNSSVPNWWVGCSFSERRMVDYAVVFALGLGYLFSLRPALATDYRMYVLAFSLIVFNWVLMSRYFMHDLPEYGDVSGKQLYVDTVEFPLRVVLRLLGGGPAPA